MRTSGRTKDGRADRRCAAGEDVVEQAPAVELHDAATGEGVGRQGVAGQVGSVDEGDVEALAGEQHRGRRAGALGRRRRRRRASRGDRSVPWRHHPPSRRSSHLERRWRADGDPACRLGQHERGGSGPVCNPTGASLLACRRPNRPTTSRGAGLTSRAWRAGYRASTRSPCCSRTSWRRPPPEPVWARTRSTRCARSTTT